MIESYRLRRRPGQQGLRQLLGNQGKLMRNELLERNTDERGQKIRSCWNATIQAIPERGYMQRIWDHWMLRNPQSRLTKKQLLAQCSNIRNRNLLSQLEINEIQQRCYGKGERGRQVSGEMSSSSPQPEIGYQAPTDTNSLNTRAADLRRKIVT